MKMKEMFKKIEAYNEIAELMGTNKAKIQFGEFFHSSRFDDYKVFRKYIQNEYIDEVAEKILNEDIFEFDKEVEIQYGDGMFSSNSKFVAELVSNY